MKFNKYAFFTTLLFCVFIIVFFGGCSDDKGSINSENGDNKETAPLPDVISQGEIIYDVEFPFINDKRLLKYLPKEFKVQFGNEKIFGEMNSKGNFICNRFFSDNSEKQVLQTFDNMGKRYQSDIDQNQMDVLIGEMPKMILGEPFMDTTILGVPCKVAMAEFEIDSVPAVKLYYTDKIKIKNPNWFNQYRELDAFLLGYDVEQFGMRMRLMAKSINANSFELISDEVYSNLAKEKFDEVSPQELQNEFEKLVQTFMP